MKITRVFAFSPPFLSREDAQLKHVMLKIGQWMFGGLLLSNITTPLSSLSSFFEFLLFISVSAGLYFSLVTLYFWGQVGKITALLLIFLLGCGSLYVTYQLALHPVPH